MRRRALLASITAGSVGLAGCAEFGSTPASETVTPTNSIPDCTTEVADSEWTLMLPPVVGTDAPSGSTSDLQSAIERVSAALRTFQDLKQVIYSDETYDGDEVDRLLRDGSSTPPSTPSIDGPIVAFARHASDSLVAVSTANALLHRQATLDPGRDIPKLRAAISFMEEAEPAIEDARSSVERARAVAGESTVTNEQETVTVGTRARLSHLDTIVTNYEWYLRGQIPRYEGLVSNLELGEHYENDELERAIAKARTAVEQFVTAKEAFCAGTPEVGPTTGEWFTGLTCRVDNFARYCRQMELAVSYDRAGNPDRQRAAAKRAEAIADEEC
ncbi:hypothetical protein ACFPYI_03920 [Halomarina salina]|uniref:DUF3829 domain-containing protein n=1 Tax=Halomarina salina TaxID=1872699 RepID=A0ABD5RJG7_9EURY|nr:hypothetical protein [Halomarina salina]